MDPGILRYRATIQAARRTDDEGGGYVETWRPISDGGVWVGVTPLTASERVRAMQTHGEMTHRVTMRYRHDVTGQMRLDYHGRTLTIQGPPVNVDERERWMEFLAREEAR